MSPNIQWKDSIQVLQHLNRHSLLDSNKCACFLHGLASKRNTKHVQKGIELVTNMGERSEIGWRNVYMVHYASNERVTKVMEVIDSLIKDKKIDKLNTHDFRVCMFKGGKSKITLARFYEKWKELRKLGLPPSLPVEAAFVRMFSFYGAHDLAQQIYLDMRSEGLELSVDNLALLVRLAKTESSQQFWTQEVKKLGLERDVLAISAKKEM
eukprot:Phypoly_transcript_18369.p1 GENE.Phypoly_transcript_18369~~Phypoly_transcript_18369.p1  ORF type:complete len:243 (+),score=41.03 Phypoly_transcript_18369:100-729(+)